MSYAFDLTVNALRKDGLTERKIVEILNSLSKELAGTTVNDKILETNIRCVLAQIYMPTHLEGYRYWVDAILICKKEGKPKMMKLYKQIAKIHHSQESRVERRMRFTKTSAFEDCPLQLIKEFFGKEVYKTKEDFEVTNSEFLSILLEKI